MRSRFLCELTTPEVESYFKSSASRGGASALLPVGCVEMHGPHMPMGTDTLVAKALALKIAEKADAIVLPEVHYTWSGATDGFAGTISIPQDMSGQMVECVVERAVAGGFSRVAIVSIHGPNNAVMYLAARRLFEKLHRPIAFINGFEPVTPEARDLFKDEFAQAKEASVVLAAMEVLGMGGLYDEKAMAVDDSAPERPKSLGALHPAQAGFYYQDMRQHACPSRLISTERGRRFLDMQAGNYADIFDKIGAYARDLESQSNTGFRRLHG